MKNNQSRSVNNDMDTRIDAYLNSNAPQQSNDVEQQLARRIQQYYQPSQEYDLALKRVQVRFEQAQQAGEASNQYTWDQFASQPTRPGQFKAPRLETRGRFTRRWSLLAAVVLTIMLLSSTLFVFHQVNLQTITSIINRQQKLQRPNTPPAQPSLPPQLYIASSYIDVLHGSSAITLYQIDAATGRAAWHFDIKPSQQSSLQGLSNPLAANGLLYIQTTDTPGMTVFALNPKSGTVVWKTLLGGNLGVRTRIVFANGLLYGVKSLATSATIFALNAQTGQLLWLHTYSDSVGPGFDTTLQVVGSSSNALYAISYQFAQNRSMLYALNAQTGMQLWQKIVSQPEKITEAQMVGQTIYLAGMSSAYPDMQAQTSIYAYDSSTGNQRWSTNITGQVSQLLAENDTLYASTEIKSNYGSLLPGSIYTLRTSDGHILWQKHFNQVIDGMFVANGEVYLNLDLDATSSALKAFRGSDGHLDWQKTIAAQFISGLGFLGSDLYFVSAGQINVLNHSDGQQVKNFPLPDSNQHVNVLLTRLLTA